MVEFDFECLCEDDFLKVVGVDVRDCGVDVFVLCFD